MHLGHWDILGRAERARRGARAARGARHLRSASARGRESVGGAAAAHARRGEARGARGERITARGRAAVHAGARRAIRRRAVRGRGAAATLPHAGARHRPRPRIRPRARRATWRSSPSSAARRGFGVEVVPPTLDDGGAPISSSSIRTSIAGGDLERARARARPSLLRCAAVVPGAQRGRTLGYPTLNIELSAAAEASPARRGLRSSRADSARRLRRHDEHRAASDLRRPTGALEVHLFDVDGDWYGERCRSSSMARLRDTSTIRRRSTRSWRSSAETPRARGSR